MYDLPVITEVMDTDQGAEVANVVLLQVGACICRTLLLKEVGKSSSVMLKHGMMASIDVWLNAAGIFYLRNRQVIL